MEVHGLIWSNSPYWKESRRWRDRLPNKAHQELLGPCFAYWQAVGHKIVNFGPGINGVRMSQG